MSHVDLPDEGSGCWVSSVRGGHGDLFVIIGCNSPSVRQAFAGEGDWLIGDEERLFP